VQLTLTRGSRWLPSPQCAVRHKARPLSPRCALRSVLQAAHRLPVLQHWLAGCGAPPCNSHWNKLGTGFTENVLAWQGAC
jgi:hypothetical protein